MRKKLKKKDIFERFKARPKMVSEWKMLVLHLESTNKFVEIRAKQQQIFGYQTTCRTIISFAKPI